MPNSALLQDCIQMSSTVEKKQDINISGTYYPEEKTVKNYTIWFEEAIPDSFQADCETSNVEELPIIRLLKDAYNHEKIPTKYISLEYEIPILDNYITYCRLKLNKYEERVFSIRSEHWMIYIYFDHVKCVNVHPGIKSKLSKKLDFFKEILNKIEVFYK